MANALRSITLRRLAIATVLVMGAGYGLAFLYAPEDADQGFIQKIFYLHVPLAIVALVGFIVAGLLAVQHLRTGDSVWDARSYVSIHLSVIFGAGVLLTGAIWAKGSWGVWWEWREPTLVSFLIVFLLYATYYPLRYAIEDRDRQARYASVFAITAGAFVPLNFAAVRMSTGYVHPRVLGDTSNLPGPMALTFLVSLVAMALLYATLCKYEMTAKHARGQLRALRRKVSGEAPVQGRSAAPSLHAGAGGSGNATPNPRPASATATSAGAPAVGRPGA
jgi:heme exporter protein C